MEFSRHEYWSGLPFPSPGCLPDPGIEPGSLALQADSLPFEPLVTLGLLRGMKEILYLYISDIDLRKYSQVMCQILDKTPVTHRL